MLPVPELPEVETVARQLQPRLAGRKVHSLRILDARLRNGRTPALRGRKIRGVRRSGKRVLIEFTAAPRHRDDLYLAVHLRMTGRLLWVPEHAPRRTSHLRARFELDRGTLLFVDTRRFGTFEWFRSDTEAAPTGVDPLESGFTPRRLDELVLGVRQNAKAWLMRQDKLVGLGNIYASEILHAARVSPLREIASLTSVERRALHRSIRRILSRAIENCGTTFSDFQDARGVSGSYQSLLAVYGRERLRCGRCGGTIRRIVQQQRSTFFCPACQR